MTEPEVGDALPPHICGPISRATLALFAGASNDYMPQHIDIDAARQSGMDDVFVHGMLSMAYLAQMLTRWVPQQRLRSWGVRFTAITPVYATLHCSGAVTEVFEEANERRARVQLSAHTNHGVLVVSGEAVVAIT